MRCAPCRHRAAHESNCNDPPQPFPPPPPPPSPPSRPPNPLSRVAQGTQEEVDPILSRFESHFGSHFGDQKRSKINILENPKMHRFWDPFWKAFGRSWAAFRSQDWPQDGGLGPAESAQTIIFVISQRLGVFRMVVDAKAISIAKWKSQDRFGSDFGRPK